MNYTCLISAESLAQYQAECLIIDCRFSLADTGLGKQQYRQGHIFGARYAHLDDHLSGKITPQTGRHPLPDFDKLAMQFGAWGIHKNSQVVVYDDASGSFAARLWWLLRTLGHSKVALLDGGIQAWQATAGELVTDQYEYAPTQFEAHLNRSAWIDVDPLQSELASGNVLLIDARAKQRFDGKAEPIDPIAGHIPDSVNLPVSENMDSHGQFLPASTIRNRYLQLMGDVPPERIVHSCGSGVFACLGVLAMEFAGLKGSKIYPGSWSEWIRDPSREVATI